jgi:hypothetical protein
MVALHGSKIPSSSLGRETRVELSHRSTLRCTANSTILGASTDGLGPNAWLQHWSNCEPFSSCTLAARFLIRHTATVGTTRGPPTVRSRTEPGSPGSPVVLLWPGTQWWVEHVDRISLPRQERAGWQGSAGGPGQRARPDRPGRHRAAGRGRDLLHRQHRHLRPPHRPGRCGKQPGRRNSRAKDLAAVVAATGVALEMPTTPALRRIGGALTHLLTDPPQEIGLVGLEGVATQTHRQDG